LALAAFAIGPESAAREQAGSIVIDDPWVATTNPGATVAAGYVTLRNTGARADRLLSATSSRAERVELHEMNVTDGVMRMRPVAGIDIPPGGTATLTPGGLHIMFLDIDAPFSDAARIP